MTEKRQVTKKIWVDPDDAPELTDEWFERADFHISGKLIRKGKPGRPKKPDAKVSVHLRLSPDVLAHYRAGGPGWQTRIDQTLRKAVKLSARRKPAKKSKPTKRAMRRR
jgi:uncharacterized protein (DUF4415 family)